MGKFRAQILNSRSPSQFSMQCLLLMLVGNFKKDLAKGLKWIFLFVLMSFLVLKPSLCHYFND